MQRTGRNHHLFSQRSQRLHRGRAGTLQWCPAVIAYAEVEPIPAAGRHLPQVARSDFGHQQRVYAPKACQAADQHGTRGTTIASRDGDDDRLPVREFPAQHIPQGRYRRDRTQQGNRCRAGSDVGDGVEVAFLGRAQCNGVLAAACDVGGDRAQDPVGQPQPVDQFGALRTGLFDRVAGSGRKGPGVREPY